VPVVQAVGAVGPLCYTTVEVAGQEVEAMVDTGSSATILSFELFKKIGKSANIPVTALSKPDIRSSEGLQQETHTCWCEG